MSTLHCQLVLDGEIDNVSFQFKWENTVAIGPHRNYTFQNRKDVSVFVCFTVFASAVTFSIFIPHQFSTLLSVVLSQILESVVRHHSCTITDLKAVPKGRQAWIFMMTSNIIIRSNSNAAMHLRALTFASLLITVVLNTITWPSLV